MKSIVYKTTEFDGFEKSDYYFQLTNGKRLSAIVHSHDFYEIFYLFDGRITHQVDGREYTVSKGQCVFLQPKNCHSITNQEENTNVFCLSISKHKFRQMQNALGFDAQLVQPFDVVEKFDVAQMEHLFFLDQQERIVQLNLLLCKLFQANLQSQTTIVSEKYPPFLADALQKMRTTENLQMGVNALVQLTGYSHAQLCRLTKNICGKTPFELVRKIRMEIIKEYLEKSNLSLEIIAEKTGYESQSQFHLATKNYFGKTPHQIRMENKYH